MLDNNALEDYRNKIMNELGRKKENKDLDRRNSDPKSRFNAPNNFNNNGFKRGRDQFRGNNRGGNRMSNFERNRNNRNREK